MYTTSFVFSFKNMNIKKKKKGWSLRKKKKIYCKLLLSSYYTLQIFLKECNIRIINKETTINGVTTSYGQYEEEVKHQKKNQNRQNSGN